MVAQGGTPRIITFWIASEESDKVVNPSKENRNVEVGFQYNKTKQQN